MADASVDIVFKGKGLTQAERKTENLARAVDKVDDKNKKLEKTEKRTGDTWAKTEKKKQQAIKKTGTQIAKVEAQQKKGEARRLKAQQGFSGAGKIGGVGGGFLGAVGEGIGTGGIGAALGIAGAAAAVGLAALTASAARAAESITKTTNVRNSLVDAIESQRNQNRQRAAAIGLSDGATALQLGAALTKDDFETISRDNANLGIDGFFKAFNQAEKQGVLGRVSVKELSGIIQRGQSQGLSAADVVSNIAKLSPIAQRSAVSTGRLAQVGLGASSGENLQAREARIATTSDPFLTNVLKQRQGARAIQAQSIQGFERGSSQILQGRILGGIVNAEATARVSVNKALQRELDLKLKIAEASERGLAVLSRLQEVGSVIGLTESATQNAARSINDNIAGLNIQ